MSTESNVTFKLTNENPNAVYIHKTIEEKNETTRILHELWIVKDNDIEVAIKGKKQDDRVYQIESLQGIPKIFLVFPLFGTQDLPFPTVVNSRKFEPTPERDGIYLGTGNANKIQQNKELLEKAIEMAIKLFSNINSNRWENIHTLLYLEYPPKKDWLDVDWYAILLKKCIDEIFKLRVLKTQSGDFITLAEGFIPIVDSLETEKVERLWDLCYCFLDYKDKIPVKELATEWASIIQKWETLGLNLTERKITVEKIATEIEACINLQGFKDKLENDKNELNTLNDFYSLLLDAEKRKLLDDKNILPDQNGKFKEKPNLSRDEGIDETLKDISNKLGIDVRNQLLHSGISENVQNLLSPKKQEEVLNQVINKIKQPRPEDDQYFRANVDLFNWLLESDKFEYFEGYPILSSKEKIFTSLSRKDKVLAPKDVWNEMARIYADLFPQEFIVSSLYFEKVPEKDKWDKLENQGLILTDPLYKEKEKISSKDLYLLLPSHERLEEEKEHEVAEEVELNHIAFLETKDKGIIDTIRKSKEKARKFLGFIFAYILESDSSWDKPIEVSCECESKHKIYPSHWIKVIKDREWVPVGRGKEEKLNSQYLASLLEKDEKLQQKCTQDKPAFLLSILNVSVGELMMNVVAEDSGIRIELDKAMGSLFSTFMTNPRQLSKIAELAKNEPELFIKEMEKRLSTREQIRRNQAIGSLIEKLLKSVLEKEGFKVERTGVGSDFSVEHDFVMDNIEQILKIEKEETICFYLEVKGTKQEIVRMTFTQAKQAKDNSNEFVLCVVKLDGLETTEDNVKNNAKFVTDIGQSIGDKVSKAENLKHEQETVVESGDIEIEISEGPIRFKIHKNIWDKGKSFGEFLRFLRVTKDV